MTKATRKGLKSTLNLGKKMNVPTSNKIKKDIDKIAEKLEVKPIKEKNVRLSIDVPQSIYKEMKIKIATDGENVRRYVLGLIKKDLGK